MCRIPNSCGQVVDPDIQGIRARRYRARGTRLHFSLAHHGELPGGKAPVFATLASLAASGARDENVTALSRVLGQSTASEEGLVVGMCENGKNSGSHVPSGLGAALLRFFTSQQQATFRAAVCSNVPEPVAHRLFQFLQEAVSILVVLIDNQAAVRSQNTIEFG